ncbi:MAG: [Fe-Fe] hydrogenase large subunit C-terminal domain-containing protein, partial [Pseudomonadota bacterium]
MSTGHLIHTIKEKCRVCYTCVRECPAKAIRISGGQAEIIPERCINCGNCVIVCAQNAKIVRDSLDEVQSLLDSGQKVAACLAPSFPAEFEDIETSKLIGMLRQVGFHQIVEVAFGADLVALEHKKLLDTNPDDHYITTSCPAIVFYVEKYHPGLVKNLIPIISPMVATARALHQDYGDDLKIVFIGPCIAKKAEARRFQENKEIDTVLTFRELRELFKWKNLGPGNAPSSHFDPPFAAKGTLFPIGGGLLQAAEIEEDLMKSNIVSTKGTKNFIHVLRSLEEGGLEGVSLVDLLCCDGCVMGPGMHSPKTRHNRQATISKHARIQFKELDQKRWAHDVERFQYLNLSQNYEINDMRLPLPSPEDLKSILANMGKYGPEDELNCGACGYDTCMEHAVAIHKGLAETEMCLPYTIEKLKKTAHELSDSYEQLANTKQALIQNEKLASMGQLAAGIAHEINNPLGVVLLYSHILMDSCPAGSEMYSDLKMIVEQSNRCKKIVSGLLNFARKNKVFLTTTRVYDLIARMLHAMIIPGNIAIEVEHKQEDLKVDIDPDQFIQVLNNITINAIEAMS